MNVQDRVLDVEAAEARAHGCEGAGEFGCLVHAGDVDGCYQGEARKWALMFQADLRVQAEESTVVVVDCHGCRGEESFGGFGEPFLADQQAVSVALVLAGLGRRCQLLADGEGDSAVPKVGT